LEGYAENIDMSSEKKGREDIELAKRVKALRKELGLSQRAFARKVWEVSGGPKARLSHTQISAWEWGRETPAVDKLIALARLARTAEERAWFWRIAGVTEEMVGATFPDLAASRVSAASAAEIVKVPLGKGFSVTDEGEIAIRSERLLLLPAEQFGSALFLWSLELDADSARFGFSPGDIVIVDRSPILTRNLLDSHLLLFFERRPEAEGVSLSSEELAQMRADAQYVSQEELEREARHFRALRPAIWAKTARDSRAVLKRTKRWMEQPVAKIGWLRLQPAGGKAEGDFGSQMWRFVLEQGWPSNVGHSIPLTDWIKGINRLTADVGPYISRPVHIVGRIVGWLRAPSQSGAG
jgi:transcriptional regulator with XRE-family HTH domain